MRHNANVIKFVTGENSSRNYHLSNIKKNNNQERKKAEKNY